MARYKIIYVFLTILSSIMFAGSEGAPHLNGEDLGILWVLPFVGILLSIAVFPLVAEHFWHHNFGRISLFWALLLIIPFIFSQGLQVTIYELLHVGLLEYVPFLILLIEILDINILPLATATLFVISLSLISTICASPVLVKCVRFFFILINFSFFIV